MVTLYPDVAGRSIMQSADVASPGVELQGWLRDHQIKISEIARFLDGLDHAERVAAIRSLGSKEQRKLYE